MPSGTGSVGRKLVKKALQTPHDGGLSRGGFQRFLGQNDQRFGMKAGGKPLEAHGRDLPVAVAARTAQQVDLPRQAFREGRTQLREQLGIVARGGGQRGIKGTCFIRHPALLWDGRLNRGLSAMRV